jgi:hypothetical protein
MGGEEREWWSLLPWWWMIKPVVGGPVPLWRLPLQEGGEGSHHPRTQAVVVVLGRVLLAQVVVWVVVGMVVVRGGVVVVRVDGESLRGRAVCWQLVGGGLVVGLEARPRLEYRHRHQRQPEGGRDGERGKRSKGLVEKENETERGVVEVATPTLRRAAAGSSTSSTSLSTTSHTHTPIPTNNTETSTTPWGLGGLVVVVDVVGRTMAIHVVAQAWGGGSCRSSTNPCLLLLPLLLLLLPPLPLP